KRAPTFRALVLFDDGTVLTEPERAFARRISVHSFQRVERLGKSGLLGFVCRLVDLVANACVDTLDVFWPKVELLDETAHISIDWIVLPLPALDLSFRDVRLVVVLGV